MEANANPAREPLWVAPLPFAANGTRRISSLLVANRGEIACRVIATCRKLNIRTIAIYATEDVSSKHVTASDDAICLGSMDQAAGNPFLNIDLLVRIALDAGADAVHPGYGYLSENVDFANAVRKAGIIYLGPQAEAITTLGDKRSAKEYLAEHEPSVPLIPGFTGSETGVQLDDLDREAERIGFPVMIKASAGGGGRGMRIARDRSSLQGEFELARSEAARSFGRADCILEKYIEVGKHVEVQIMGDQHGNVISLWERDCSVQRRHQKVIEETPCTWLSQSQREAMCQTAVRIGKLLSYEGAGTVEFIVDVTTAKYYFLEVNARLQVEHPITEECTGLDVVGLQLYVASGGNLAKLPKLAKIPQIGHAIECRLCAEDPERDFAPQQGLIRLWSESRHADPRNVRYETAVDSGSRVSIHFDSMIAKIVVWAPTRSMAIDKMARILADTTCIGIRTNQLFLQACLLHRDLRNPASSTAFIPTNIDVLLKNPYDNKLGLSQDHLAILPSMLLRQSFGSNPTRPLFATIRQGFRNQRYDRINVPSDIVLRIDPANQSDDRAAVCLWKYDTTYNPRQAIVRVGRLPVTSPSVGAEASGEALVSEAYNKLSTAIRTDSLPGSTQYSTVLEHLRSWTASEGSTLSWSVGRCEVSVGGKRVSAMFAAPDDQDRNKEPCTGGKKVVYLHLPALGTSIEYHCYSPLSYFESQRLAVAGAAGGDAGTTKAPMPCKVLRVLKKSGDEVKTGEVVMVVESMKMEMSISAGKDGKLEVLVKEGDSADDGVILCTVN